ncbi:hypothetical protein [Kluyvera sp. CRP]|uniref:hypothetical protein n=1 Tax=Kluyvera sp. CRP TaxID=2873269 RepID=UPI001CC1E4FD|nr:hypothetical protein [Kluyvera sp. CRP]UAK19113.1 hypothetical protein K7B04_17550 [Kluyvera sp. CRP]
MTGLLIAGYRCGECQRWYFTNNKRANFQETQLTTVNMRKLCDGYHEKNALMLGGNNMGALWSGDVFIYTWFFFQALYYPSAEKRTILIKSSSKLSY